MTGFHMAWLQRQAKSNKEVWVDLSVSQLGEWKGLLPLHGLKLILPN
jgi:hypothetical protein